LAKLTFYIYNNTFRMSHVTFRQIPQ